MGEEEMEEDEVAEMSVKRPWRPSRLLLCDITWNEGDRTGTMESGTATLAAETRYVTAGDCLWQMTGRGPVEGARAR